MVMNRKPWSVVLSTRTKKFFPSVAWLNNHDPDGRISEHSGSQKKVWALDRFSNHCPWWLSTKKSGYRAICSRLTLEPVSRFELLTPWLRIKCSTNWAIPAETKTHTTDTTGPEGWDGVNTSDEPAARDDGNPSIKQFTVYPQSDVTRKTVFHPMSSVIG